MPEVEYKVVMTKTSAPSPQKLHTDEHHTYDEEIESFDSFEELKDFIDRRYPDSGQPMYRDLHPADTTGDETGHQQVGWIFNQWMNTYREKGKHYEQHWVEVRELTHKRENENGKIVDVEETRYPEDKIRQLAKKSSSRP